MMMQDLQGDDDVGGDEEEGGPQQPNESRGPKREPESGLASAMSTTGQTERAPC